MEKETMQVVQQNGHLQLLEEALAKRTPPAGKTSFLIYRHNRYIIVPVEKIAFFSVKHQSTVMVCFDRKEYVVNYSLDHIQGLLTEKQFFRVNRQYLINFRAIKDVEHYFARKLLVNPTISVSDKLLVPKEKASVFLYWLDNR